MVTTDPPVSASEKREALETVLNSDTFARSGQLRALLRHICEKELAGHGEELTEYEIAVEVLGRRKDVSTVEDSSVRNRAYELRQRLEKYYSSEQPHAPVRIQIPRGGYLPHYTRPSVALEHTRPEPTIEFMAGPPRARWRFGPWSVVTIAVACLAAGFFLADFSRTGPPRPASILREAWGPLADRGDDFLLSIATNMHMIVRPHIGPYPLRYPAPREVYPLYGPQRPLAPGGELFMEPAQLSVPLGELAAAVELCNMRAQFGGGFQILPEAEAPVTALRGRNGALIGSGTNSQAASILLVNLPFTIDYTSENRFAVFDRRKPAGQNQLFESQPIGTPVPAVQYGLLTVITSADPLGKPRRTLVLSGSGSAAVQSAVEFFCSPAAMSQMKQRFLNAGLKGFPATYQVVVRCRTSGVRLMSYEYAAHAHVD
ncbi:MAG: hypothetical protein ABSE56_23195 [Bryobacteraceae bacterium]|jgi:hypothetical protein